MVEYSSEFRVSTVDTSLLPAKPTRVEISNKKFWTKKCKWTHTVQGTASVPWTPPFHRCDLQKSRYEIKILWTEKQK